MIKTIRTLAAVVLLGLLCSSCTSSTEPLFIVFERFQAGLQERILRVDDHMIAYLEGGKGPDILLIHGFGADKDNWDRFAKRLTTSYHVIAIDLPGFGDSSKIREGKYDIPTQVKRINSFVRAIGLNKFHIAGNSMGGLISGIYTTEYPDEILSLGLFDTGGVIDREESDVSREWKEGRNPLVVRSREEFDLMFAFMFVDPPYIPFWIKSWLADQSIRNSEFNQFIFPQSKPGDQLERVMGKISAKTLVLWGDKDRIFPVSSAAVLGNGIKNSKVVIMKDCGHLPMLERPGEAAQHYLDFLG
jgi:abhydrolase domain-containing protein 6